MSNLCNKIAVLCCHEFPVGLASTSRILAYCTGLKANGVSPEVFTFRWIGDDEGKPLGGVVDGIPYKNSHLWHTRRGKLYKMLIDRPKVFSGAIKNLKESHHQLPFDWVFISTDSLQHLEYYVPKIKRLGIKVAFIGDEFPEPIRNKLVENITPKQRRRYKKIYEQIDARILMTKSLQIFYDNEVCPKPTYILPSIVNAERFERAVTREERKKSNYLCYMGGLDPTSDNLDVMIKAFAKVVKSYPELILRLYGAPSPANRQFFETVARQEGVDDKVLFMGRVRNDEVPGIMTHAKIVMTSQPDNMRIRGSFSTKIGEYLASGTPTLVTKVGSIPLYFKHDTHLFYAKVNDVDDYACQIENILSNYEHAMDVASVGRKYITECFNGKYLTKGLVDFLKIVK